MSRCFTPPDPNKRVLTPYGPKVNTKYSRCLIAFRLAGDRDITRVVCVHRLAGDRDITRGRLVLHGKRGAFLWDSLMRGFGGYFHTGGLGWAYGAACIVEVKARVASLW